MEVREFSGVKAKQFADDLKMGPTHVAREMQRVADKFRIKASPSPQLVTRWFRNEGRPDSDNLELLRVALQRKRIDDLYAARVQ